MNGLFGLVSGYALAQIPPFHDRSKGKASALIVSCIDPRYTNDLAWYLTHNQELHADYDLVCFAGAELGILHQPAWKQTFYDHIDLAIKLHGIKEIWSFSHLDCGMYKATLNLDDDKKDDIHIDSMKELRKELANNPKYSFLEFKGFIISINGFVKQVL